MYLSGSHTHTHTLDLELFTTAESYTTVLGLATVYISHSQLVVLLTHDQTLTTLLTFSASTRVSRLNTVYPAEWIVVCASTHHPRANLSIRVVQHVMLQ